VEKAPSQPHRAARHRREPGSGDLQRTCHSPRRLLALLLSTLITATALRDTAPSTDQRQGTASGTAKRSIGAWQKLPKASGKAAT